MKTCRPLGGPTAVGCPLGHSICNQEDVLSERVARSALEETGILTEFCSADSGLIPFSLSALELYDATAFNLAVTPPGAWSGDYSRNS